MDAKGGEGQGEWIEEPGSDGRALIRSRRAHAGVAESVPDDFSVPADGGFRGRASLKAKVAISVVSVLLLLTFISMVSTPSSAPGSDSSPSLPLEAPRDGEVVQNVTDWPLPTRYERPQLAYCTTEGCTWLRVGERKTIQQNSERRIVRLILVGGETGPNETTYRGVRKIKWQDKPFAVFALCASDLPVLAFYESGKWQATPLDFVNGPPTVEQGDAAYYSIACHGSPSAYTQPGFAEQYHYRQPHLDTVAMDSLDELFTAQDVAALAEAPADSGSKIGDGVSSLWQDMQRYASDDQPINCQTIQQDFFKLAKDQKGIEVIEVNNVKETWKGSDVSCTGDAITTNGPAFVNYGTTTTPQGKNLLTYIVIPSGL